MWRVRWLNYLKMGLAVFLAALLARAAYSISHEGGWLLLMIIVILAAAKLLSDTWPTAVEFRRRGRRARPPRIAALNKLLKELPRTSGAVCYVLRRMLIDKLSLRTGLPPSLVEERALEYVEDGELRMLLEGKLTFKSEREVEEVIERLKGL